MLCVTGDIHGRPFERWSFDNHPKLRELDTDDIMIQLGDFGVLFNPDTEYTEVQRKLDWINLRPWTTLVVRGNHDNEEMWTHCPIVEKWNGKVRQCVYAGRIYEKIFLVNESTILDLPNGSRIEHCLLIPGAHSHDIDHLLDPEDKDFRKKAYDLSCCGEFFRTIGKNWWPTEKVDIAATKELLKDHQEHFDFIFTHDYPAIVNQPYSRKMRPRRVESTDSQEYFDELRLTLDFDAWFHGHFHIDGECQYDSRVQGLFCDILSLGEDE